MGSRGRWGGPPGGAPPPGTKPATDLAFVKRDPAALPALVRQDIPELEIKAAAAGAAPQTGTAPGTSDPKTDSKPETKKKKGCGCGASGGSASALLGLAVLGLLVRRRRS